MASNGSNPDEGIVIDGSIMEGGGQILRNAVSFACLLNTSVSIHNIRGGRSNPGLRPQHMTGLQLIREITSGKLFGDNIGSMSVTLHPSSVGCGTFIADTKTAGSICLLIQLALPCLLFSPGVSTLILKGGTHAEMAPPLDYITEIFQPIVKKLGVEFDCNLVRSGYYPKGGGEVRVAVNPIKQLQPLQLLERGPLARITGRAFVAGVLPLKIAQTMAREADRILKKKYPNIDINIEPVKEPANKAHGNGSGIVVIAESETGCRLGGSALGKKGVPGEEVARNAVDKLTNNLQHDGCVDEFLQDQLIIFMALAKGHSSLKCGPLTMHTETAIHIAEKIMKAKIKVQQVSDKEGCIIECDGIGLQNQNL
ncbi:RNA 3'-terminal phosphate cyclase-like isoform X1 [Acropora muricata]|uniref:RNA 3'-terminal phosphate cyclase-like isoform X1 n=2 Tax=Acropora muricata TaxID=159855 RepID=UPI0034E48185